MLAEVVWHHNPLPKPLLDLDLQVGVGLLQRPHLLQVAGQAVVQVVHGGLLVEVEAHAEVRFEHGAEVEGPLGPGSIACRDPHPASTSATVDTQPGTLLVVRGFGSGIPLEGFDTHYEAVGS